MTHSDKLCPCGSGESYEQCCRRFHRGDDLPKDALQLMRSRYAAYVLNLPEYLIKTTHPANPFYLENKFAWKRSKSQFSRESTFKRLEILDFQEKGLLATVTFTAFLSKGDADATFTEISYFEKFKGKWLYLRGQLSRGYTPEVVTEGPLKVLPLAYYGEPVLQREADPVAEIDVSTKLLIEEMIATMKASSGIGIAACRKATIDDLQAIVDLLIEDELGKTREQHAEELDLCYIDAFQKIDADPNQFLLLAIMDEKIVGTCHLTIMPSLTFRGSTRMQIEAVRITKEHRSHNIGTWMMNAAIEYGKENGASLIQLTTNKKRYRAKQFYERLGFVASHEGMKLHLI